MSATGYSFPGVLNSREEQIVDNNISSPTGVELFSKGIYGYQSQNAKLFEWIAHFGIWYGKNVNKRKLLHNAL